MARQRLIHLQPVPSGPDAERDALVPTADRHAGRYRVSGQLLDRMAEVVEPRVSGPPCSELRIDTDVGGSTR
jgi:hypothetical protein